MSKLNWRNARLDGKRSTSIVDESEYRSSDAAARWLERATKRKQARKPKAKWKGKAA